jgi:hypothetical protein
MFKSVLSRWSGMLGGALVFWSLGPPEVRQPIKYVSLVMAEATCCLVMVFRIVWSYVADPPLVVLCWRAMLLRFYTGVCAMELFLVGTLPELLSNFLIVNSTIYFIFWKKGFLFLCGYWSYSTSYLLKYRIAAINGRLLFIRVLLTYETGYQIHEWKLRTFENGGISGPKRDEVKIA